MAQADNLYEIECFPSEICPNGEPTKRSCGSAGSQILDWAFITEANLKCWFKCTKKINVQVNGYYSMITVRGLYQQFDTFNDDVPMISPADPCTCGAVEKYFQKKKQVDTHFHFQPCFGGGTNDCTAKNDIDVILKFYTTKNAARAGGIYVQVPNVTLGSQAYGLDCSLNGLGANQRITYFDTCLGYPKPVIDALACGIKYKVARWTFSGKTITYSVSWSWQSCNSPPDCKGKGEMHDRQQTGSVTVIITSTQNCTGTKCSKC
jgi:hypothetical protein